MFTRASDPPANGIPLLARLSSRAQAAKSRLGKVNDLHTTQKRISSMEISLRTATMDGIGQD